MKKKTKTIADEVIAKMTKSPKRIKKMYSLKADVVQKIKDAAEKSGEGESYFLEQLIEACFKSD